MKKNLYTPNNPDPFKLSRSKIELFVKCPYCFYLDRCLGISRPSCPAYTLNSAVDTLLKRECDGYRAQGQPHPIAVQYGLDAVPYQTNPVELMDTWRSNFKGINFHHASTNFHVYGAVDDIWGTPNGELIVIDYKTTAKAGEIVLDKGYHEAYKRQLDLYGWLLHMNGYPVHPKAYFVYANGIKDMQTFDNYLRFKTVLIEHILDMDWIEMQLLEAHACLNQSEMPLRGEGCEWCQYLKAFEDLKGRHSTKEQFSDVV